MHVTDDRIRPRTPQDALTPLPDRFPVQHLAGFTLPRNLVPYRRLALFCHLPGSFLRGSPPLLVRETTGFHGCFDCPIFINDLTTS